MKGERQKGKERETWWSEREAQKKRAISRRVLKSSCAD